MGSPVFSRKMQSVVKRSLIFSVLAVILVCLIFGVIGKSVPERCTSHSEAKWYEGKDLKLVHVLFRHGHRTPVDTYPNDPHINDKLFPYGWGELTNQGKQYLYDMGEYLRKRYNTFLGETYIPDIAYALSTGTTRTKMSIQLVLSALFAPKGSANEWNKKLDWQPIPFDYQDLDKDNLLLVRTSCPRYHEALEGVLASAEVQAELEPLREMMEELTQITGLNITTPEDISSLYSTLRTEEEFGLELPKWTQNYYPDRLYNMTVRSYLYSIWTDEMKRLKAGPFVTKIVKEWEEKAKELLKPQDRKIFVYTGHDSSVVNIMSAFNVWDEQWPNYAIMGMWELLQDKQTGQFGVQMYLKNSSAPAIPLTIPGCDFFCPLERVVKSLQHLMEPSDRTLTCKSEDPNYIPPAERGP